MISVPLSLRSCWKLMRVNSTNVLDEGLRIRGIGRRMNSKVKSVKQGVYREKMWWSTWLTLNLSLTGLSWPLYIGGQVSRNRSGPIHITMSEYDIDSYFDYDYTWA
jgi:hypothetical protein